MLDWGPYTEYRKVWRSSKTDTMPPLSVAHCAMLLGTPSSNIHEKVIIYWNLLWDVPPGWRSYFTFLSEGGLLNLCGDPIVQLKAGPVETRYPWNGTYTTESGRRVGDITGRSRLLSSWLIMLTLPTWRYVSPGQVPKTDNLDLLKIRWAMFCFRLVWSFDCHLFVPSLTWTTSYHTENPLLNPPSKFKW